MTEAKLSQFYQTVLQVTCVKGALKWLILVLFCTLWWCHLCAPGPAGSHGEPWPQSEGVWGCYASLRITQAKVKFLCRHTHTQTDTKNKLPLCMNLCELPELLLVIKHIFLFLSCSISVRLSQFCVVSFSNLVFNQCWSWMRSDKAGS